MTSRQQYFAKTIQKLNKQNQQVDSIRVWFTESGARRKFFSEEFWSIDYDAFMKEYDGFMKTKVSPLFFQTNLANFATLFDRIDRSEYYLIPRKDTLQDLTTVDYILDCPDKKKLPYQQFRKSHIQGYYVQNRQFYPRYDCMPLAYDEENRIIARKIYWLKDLWNEHKPKLVALLIKAFQSCHYDDIFNFYIAFIDFIYHHDKKSYRSENLAMSIFFNFPESMKEYPLYFSFNQPRVEKFIRVLPTRFVACCCNPLVTVDKEFMTITRDLSHDIFAHKQLIKSRIYTVIPSAEIFARNICNFIVRYHPDFIEEFFNISHEDSVIIGTFIFARRISKYPIFKDFPIQYIPDQIMQQHDLDL